MHHKMSFMVFKDVIEENDLIILHINFQTLYPIKVTPTTSSKKGNIVENIFQTKYGSLKVEELVGKKYGSKVKLSRGYAYVLRPTPELWTKALPHRTQILYATDISMIILQLELKPGSVCIETGTGSGSLSHSLIRTIAPTGHLHTFDFHQQRVEKAQVEFEEHGLGQFVTCKQRDACTEGFDLVGKADAVFLDLPHPWLVIGHAKTAMKKRGGRICSFSPCIEQVQKTCEELNSQGFTEISTLECLLREFQVRKIALPVFDPALESDWVPVRNGVEGGRGVKRKHTAESREEAGQEDESIGGEEEVENGSHQRCPDSKFLTGLPLTTMPGHTGYLTFATLPASFS